MPKIVGLVPAAGLAKRISPLPFSKELLPVGFQNSVVDGQSRLQPKVVSQYLLERMILAKAEKIYIVISPSKLDILGYYGDGSDIGVPISYLVMSQLWGMPYTLNQARHWLTDETVIFGMPDTIFQPEDAFVRLLDKHTSQQSDLTLGLFPTDQPQRFTVVQTDQNNHVLSVIDKPTQRAWTQSTYTWGIACWSPRFTSFMDGYLKKPLVSDSEIVLSEVFQAAIDSRLNVLGLRFEDGDYVDVGTPEELMRAMKRFNDIHSNL